MWVVVGEEMMDKKKWEEYHEMEKQNIHDVMRWGWVYCETYEKYCEEFKKAKAGLFDDVEEVARIRKSLYTMDYGKAWEECCDCYSDYHKDVYGYRPKDIGDILAYKGVTMEQRKAMWQKMEEERRAGA